MKRTMLICIATSCSDFRGEAERNKSDWNEAERMFALKKANSVVYVEIKNTRRDFPYAFRGA